MKRNSRHDTVALARQKNLAAILIVANLIVGVLLGTVTVLSDWEPGLTNPQLIACIALFAVSWLSLLIAAGIVEWVPRALPSMLTEGPHGEAELPALAKFVARRRMIFYYPGIIANLLGIALVSEVTGGLAESPFVALLIAFVLTGQQLSRFRTQSGVLFALGMAAALLMWAFEPLFGKPDPAAPHELEIAAVLLALATGGALNYFEKSHNYLLERHVYKPSHVRIYTDGKGIWRYALYNDIHRQDSVLLAPEDPTAPLDEGGFPPNLKQNFEQLAKAMGEAADWKDLEPDWPKECEASFAMRLVVRKGQAH